MFIDQTLPPLAVKLKNKLHVSSAREILQALHGRASAAQERIDSPPSVAETIADPALGPFISMITHDLRTPLATAIGYAELLCANYPTPLSEEQANYARAILENTRRAADLIGSLSEAFAALSGNLVLEREWVDLSKLIRGMAEELRSYLTQAGQVLHVIEESDVRWIPVDQARLVKALQLLIRFVTRELPTVKTFHLHVAHTANGTDQILLSLRAIDEPSDGMQIHPSVLAQRRGRSLPVLIATAFIEAHGGRLTWPDPEMQGTIARVHLPLDL